jgi:hypothetical protein
MPELDGKGKSPAAVGAAATVDFATDANEHQLARSFLADELTSEQQIKMVALFQWLADFGKIVNREKFKKLSGTDNIYEFKHNQIRIGCFQSGRYWYLTHGFIKKKDDWPPTEVARAERIRTEHLSRKKTLRSV